MPPPPVLMFLSVCALAVLRSPHFRRLSSTLTRSDFKLHQCCLERFCGLTKARMRIAELERVAGAMRHAVKAAEQPPITATIETSSSAACAADDVSDA